MLQPEAGQSEYPSYLASYKDGTVKNSPTHTKHVIIVTCAAFVQLVFLFKLNSSNINQLAIVLFIMK